MRTRVIQEQREPSTEGREVAARGVMTPTRRRGRLASLIVRHPLAAFFVIAFALTWVTVPLGTFMAGGPLVASLIVLGVTEGQAGIRALGRRMVQWRVGWYLYVAALLVPLAVGFAAGGANLAFGASDVAFANLEVSALVLLFVLRLVVPVFAPLGEEAGWRGFALPRRRPPPTPFAATLGLGVIVAAWPLPLLAISAEKFEPVMLVGTVFVTFWYTWLFNRSGGSVFITIVAHAADGLIGAKLLADDGGFHGTAADRFEYLYCAAWLLVAVVLVATDRRRWFAPVTDDALVEPAPEKRAGRRLVGATAVATVVVTLGIVACAGVASAKTVDRDAY